MTVGDTAGPDELRGRLRSARRLLAPEVRHRAAHAVGEHLCALPELQGPGRIATYRPSDGELDPNRSLQAVRAGGWQVHLPVIGAGRSMHFAPWDETTELVPNRYGIEEPHPDLGHPLRAAEELDVVLVPCVAVDLTGNRVGFGAGYYDRSLSAVTEGGPPVLIGIAYDDAVVDSLQARPWDVAMDIVVTERRVLRV